MQDSGKARASGRRNADSKVRVIVNDAAAKRKTSSKEAESPKVLMFLSNAYDPDPRVRQEALSLLDMGCDVRIVAWDRERKAPEFQNMEGVAVERVFLTSTHGRGNAQIVFYALLYLRMLWRGISTPFDVVHCHDLDTLPLGFLLGRLKRKPVIYDAHESFPDMLAGHVSPVVTRGLVGLEDFLIRRTELLITVGEKLRRHFIERGARHCVVVGNWKRVEEYSGGEEKSGEIRKCLGIPSDAIVVVCVTQLLKDRKLEEFMEAVDGCPNVWAIIGGQGVLQDAVKGWAKRNSRICYVGFVRTEEIPAYTCAADIVYYGFDPANPNARFSAPNKLFEALAAGRPLITGDFGEIADVVREASCGVVLPQYSVEEIRKGIETLQDSKVRAGMASNAKQFGRTFMNWQKGEEVLCEEYSKLLPFSALRLAGSRGGVAKETGPACPGIAPKVGVQ